MPIFAALGLCTCLLVFSILDPRYLLYWLTAGLLVLFAPRSRELAIGVVGAILMAGGAVFLELASASRSFDTLSFIPESVPQTIFCVGACLLILSLATEKAGRALSKIAGFASGLSAFSYTLYLIHYPTNAALSLFLPKAASVSASALALFGLRIAICVGVSFIMYLLFERWTPVARRKLYALATRSAKRRRSRGAVGSGVVVTMT